MVGGLSEIKIPDSEVVDIVNKIKSNFEEENYETKKFEVIQYKTQVVNGVNYFMKIETDKEYVHLRIYKSLPHTGSEISLIKTILDKKKECEIIYF